MEMVELVSGSFGSLCGVRYSPQRFSHISLCLALLFVPTSPSCLIFHCLISSSPFILEFTMSLAEFIVSASFSAYMKSEYFVSLVSVLQPGFTPLSHINSIILFIFSTYVSCSFVTSHASDKSVIMPSMISTNSV